MGSRVQDNLLLGRSGDSKNLKGGIIGLTITALHCTNGPVSGHDSFGQRDQYHEFPPFLSEQFLVSTTGVALFLVELLIGLCMCVVNVYILHLFAYVIRISCSFSAYVSCFF